MLVAVDRTQRRNVVTWSITDGRKDLIEREKSRPEPDFVDPSVFIRYAGLLVLRSTNGMVWWEKFKFCKSGMSRSYHFQYQTILRMMSPTLAVNESGSN